MRQEIIIQIGADKLILWLREKGYAGNVRNNILGRQIHDEIIRRGGNLLERERRKRVKWTEVQCKNPGIGPYLLPRTAAQYEINKSKLNRLYEWLNTL